MMRPHACTKPAPPGPASISPNRENGAGRASGGTRAWRPGLAGARGVPPAAAAANAASGPPRGSAAKRRNARCREWAAIPAAPPGRGGAPGGMAWRRRGDAAVQAGGAGD